MKPLGTQQPLGILSLCEMGLKLAKKFNIYQREPGRAGRGWFHTNTLSLGHEAKITVPQMVWRKLAHECTN